MRISDWSSDVCSSYLLAAVSGKITARGEVDRALAIAKARAQRDRVRIAVIDVIAEVGADRMPLDVGAVAKGSVRLEEAVGRIAEQVLRAARRDAEAGDRKSTRLNSSH